MSRRDVGWRTMMFLGAVVGCSDGAVVATMPDVVTGADVTALPDAALSPDAAPLSDVVVPPGLDAALRDAPSVDLGPTDAPCVGGATRCGDQCVSLRSDHEHCGACGNVCAAGERCEMGRCALTCPAGATVCQPDGGAARCVDLQRDPASCGACGTVCPAGTVCMAGVCATACAASLTACGQSCRNLQTDPQHCGACGTACPAGQACERGACVCDVTRRSCMVSGAPTCVDTATDSRHCGRCDNPCAAGTRCENGRCEASCSPGLLACGGACVDTNSSPENCGACGRTCPPTANRPTVCINGNCSQGACTEPYADCDQSFANGCETNLRANPAHCGRCGISCGTPSYGRAECSDGACTILCNTAHGDCDGNPTNGCESDFNTDTRHCGGCGRACPSGQGCRNGVCVSTVGALLCSTQAALTCLSLGGRTPTNAQDGRIVCVFGNVSITDFCGQSCNTYRVFSWRDGAQLPACVSTPGSMARGSSYTGPAFCGCDQPPRSCGTWDMNNCVGD